MPTKGSRIGRWKLIRGLGSGGNSVVWLAEDDLNSRVAIKVLKPPEGTERYERFAREISTHLDVLGSAPGVLPVLEAELPALVEGMAPPWLAMPIAKPLVDHLGKPPENLVAVAAVLEIARTLANLHRLHGLSHRDIKPQNLYWFDGSPAIGDFGLVTGPDDSTLTRDDRDLGPRDFLAPEMRRGLSMRGGPPADVFSLGLTLFDMLVGDSPRDGLRADIDDHSLERCLNDPSLHRLDSVLQRATAYNAEARLTMVQFVEELEAFLAPPSSEVSGPLEPAPFRRRIEDMARRLHGPEPAPDLNEVLGPLLTQASNGAKPVFDFLNSLGLVSTRAQTRLFERLDTESLGIFTGFSLTLEHDGSDGAVWFGGGVAAGFAGDRLAHLISGWVIARHDDFPEVLWSDTTRCRLNSLRGQHDIDRAIAAWRDQASLATDRFIAAAEAFASVPRIEPARRDTEPPSFARLHLSSRLVDQGGAVEVIAKAQLLDDISGLAGNGPGSPSQLRLRGPGGESLDLMLSADGNRVSGTRQNGFYEGVCRVEFFQPDGLWQVEYLLLADVAGHLRYVYPDELERYGADIVIEIRR